MRRTDLSGDSELVLLALITFSAVSLGTLEFIRNAFPDVDAVPIPKSTITYTIILVQGVPTVMLLVADRAIAAWDKSGRALQAFRAALFAVAFLLILRQLQLYWGPGENITETVRSASVVLLVVAGLVVAAGVVWLCSRLIRGVRLFFLYMSPVAIAMTAIVPFQMQTGIAPQEGYSQEVERAQDRGSKPAVFILILDELAYEVLTNQGELDTERFPNFAKLARDGAWFTNATSNQFRTQVSSPAIINSATALAEEFDVRLYLQFPTVETRHNMQCGKAYTCRGASYLAENDRFSVATNLALRSLYQATPSLVETVTNTPAGWLIGRLGSAYPQVDSDGYHILTKKIFDTLLNDIEGQEALGRISVLHLLLPHFPFAFNEEGKAISSRTPGDWEAYWERYRNQTMFADLLVGRLVDRLEDEGIYDRSVIVVTSDHGLRRSVPTPPLTEPIEVDSLMVQVPLLIRAPGIENQVSDVDYQHVDFGATLTDVLGLPPPEGTKGVSAFSQERPERDKVFHVDDWTYIYNPEDDSWHVSQE